MVTVTVFSVPPRMMLATCQTSSSTEITCMTTAI